MPRSVTPSRIARALLLHEVWASIPQQPRTRPHNTTETYRLPRLLELLKVLNESELWHSTGVSTKSRQAPQNERTARSICPAAYINTSGPGELGKHCAQARPLQNLRSRAPLIRYALGRRLPFRAVDLF